MVKGCFGEDGGKILICYLKRSEWK